MPPPHHKPIDSSRVGTGQSSRRGRVRCQSPFIAGERRRCEPGSNSVIVTNTFYRVLRGMLQVLATCNARGRFLSAVRQSAPSGTSRRGFETPGLRLLVTGSIHYTVKFASAAPRRRRKSKIVHAQEYRVKYRPGLLIASSRRSHAQARHSRGGGNPEKNKARRHPLSLPQHRSPLPLGGRGLG